MIRRVPALQAGVAMLLVVALSGSLPASEEENRLAERGRRLLQRVYALPSTECPAGLDRIGDATRAVCGRYEQGFDRLKASLKRFDSKPNRAVTRTTENDSGLPPSRHTGRSFTFHRNWQRHERLRFRDWLEDDDLVVVALDESAGLVAVLPKDSCLAPEVRARTDLYFGGGPEFVEAEILEGPLPPAPGKSPSGLRKGGDAVVQFVVTSEGAVADACVLHSRPGGFGRRALKTLDRWRFAAATDAGRPVDSIVSVHFRWRQEEAGYERTARPLPRDGS